MSNEEIRIAIIKANIKQYEVAKQLGVTEAFFSRKLRYEMTQEEKDKILQAIEELKNNT